MITLIVNHFTFKVLLWKFFCMFLRDICYRHMLAWGWIGLDPHKSLEEYGVFLVDGCTHDDWDFTELFATTTGAPNPKFVENKL